ncbi:hypothetical protein DEO72_LG7g2487 [Vigna unguiculata]|uniref:Neprosin PEP catalytic domain-containing protein n=1 Tax=Vigna unguiculata TaxID=3917 RepID=A0A4D6MIG8_VIGUN|nr:hypothetical protein DEO72_LG7g2487 [Vigna unguiculata]
MLYGDNATHFYTSWTTDNFWKTGCFNVRCPGFIQIDKRKIYLGGRVSNISVYGGPIFEIPITLTLDPMTKSWWLSSGQTSIGYFPAALFKNFESASVVGWGGRTRTDVGNTSPEMGSGYFPDRKMTHSCYFRSALIEDESRKIFPPKPDQTSSFSDVTKCYGVIYYGDQGGYLGAVLLFGGPGRVCGD